MIIVTMNQGASDGHETDFVKLGRDKLLQFYLQTHGSAHFSKGIHDDSF